MDSNYCQAQFKLAIDVAIETELVLLSTTTNTTTNTPTVKVSKMTKMEDDQEYRQLKWRSPKWKMTKMEEDQNGRQPNMEDKLGIDFTPGQAF